MLFVFAIVFLLKRYGTYAIPLPDPPPGTSPPFSAYDVSIFPRDDSTTSGGRHRTVLGILWSCLATTFACTWVSIHPNVPWKGEGKWTILGRRIYLMFFSILAPEFMAVWAFKQWRGARMIRETVNDSIKKAYSGPEHQMPGLWTTAHGHFLQMGGFRLCATSRENFYWGGSIAIGRRNDLPEKVEEQHHLRTYIGRQRESINESYPYFFERRARLRVSESGQLHRKNRQLRRTNRREFFENVISQCEFYRREAPSELGIMQSYEYDDAEMTSDEFIWEGALRIKALKNLLEEKLIQLPTITADEINDRSKGDAVSKGLALLQLTWFVVQIITRASRGLAISELELTTAALAGMNSVMYFFWWSKPRDVRFPVVVRTKHVEKLLAERVLAERPLERRLFAERLDNDVMWEFSGDEFDFRKHLWASVEEACVLVDFRYILYKACICFISLL